MHRNNAYNDTSLKWYTINIRLFVKPGVFALSPEKGIACNNIDF